MFPVTRHRRLRQNKAIRAMVRETKVSIDDLMAPLFVVPGEKIKKPISSLAGQFQFSVDEVVKEVISLSELGIKSILLFGIPESKDEIGAIASDPNGIVQQAIRAIKAKVPEMLITADLCFCEYTSHGHCGVIRNHDVDNDLTLEELQKQAISLTKAGADIIAPSGMMDGMVLAIREALDDNNFENTIILSYSAKYASAFYGPFREAVNSAPQFGDRKTYQMDPANVEEAIREVSSDIEEGADIIMVKPALAYLDVIQRVKEHYQIPIAAYNVSGEYAMVHAAAKAGLIDGQRVMQEILLSIKRAGADIIITYFAKDFASYLKAVQ